MHKQLDGFRRQFAARHPEAGEISAGSVMTGSQAMALGDVFASKVTSIRRKPELTNRDATFLDSVTDLGSRSIVWCLEKGSLSAPSDEQLIAGLLAKAYVTPKHQASRIDASSSSARDRLVDELGNLTGSNASVRGAPHLREQAEDFAGAVIPFLGMMVAESARGLQVDNYLAGNLQALLAQYEMHDEAQALGQ